MISLGEIAVVLILILLIVLLLDLGVLSQVRNLEEKAMDIENFFEKDREEDLQVKTELGESGRYG